jgi:hypothetical protein
LADEVSPLFLLFLAPFSFFFFFEDPSSIGERLFLQKNSFVEDYLMGRINVRTRNGKRLYGVCGILGGVECALFNVNETLPCMIWWRLENQSLMKE